MTSSVQGGPNDSPINGVASVMAQSGAIFAKKSSQDAGGSGMGTISRFNTLPVRSAFSKDYKNRSDLNLKVVKSALAKNPQAQSAGLALGNILSGALASKAKTAETTASAAVKEISAEALNPSSSAINNGAGDTRTTASTVSQKKLSDPGSGFGNLAVGRSEDSSSDDEIFDENSDEADTEIDELSASGKTPVRRNGDANLFSDENSIFSNITKAYRANYKNVLQKD